MSKEIKLRKRMGSSRARLFAQNFDARLAGIVISSDRPYDEKIPGDLNIANKYTIHKIHVPKFQGRVFFEVAEDTDAPCWETLKPATNVNVQQYNNISQFPTIYIYIYIYIYIRRSGV